MITITRRQARRLRGVFRRSVLGISHRGTDPAPRPPRRGDATTGAISVRGDLAVEHVEPGIVPAARGDRPAARRPGRLRGPRRLARRPGGRRARPHASSAGRTAASRRPASTPSRRSTRWRRSPSRPRSWTEVPAGLLDALAEATPDQRRRQHAVRPELPPAQGGHPRGRRHRRPPAARLRAASPSPGRTTSWSGARPSSPARTLPRDQPVSIGKTDTHVVLRVGPWTLVPGDPDRRPLPRVDQVIPDAQATATRLRLDAEDAAFLGQALDRLPGADELNSPATVDLNGQVAVRARAADQTQVTELVLTRSRYTGTPVRLNTNREFLARALRLGFTEIEIVDADTPLVCRDRQPRLLLAAPVARVGDRAGRRRHPHRVRFPDHPRGHPARMRRPQARTTVNERTRRTARTPRPGTTPGANGATARSCRPREPRPRQPGGADPGGRGAARGPGRRPGAGRPPDRGPAPLPPPRAARARAPWPRSSQLKLPEVAG